jgi:hypothetical protein
MDVVVGRMLRVEMNAATNSGESCFGGHSDADADGVVSLIAKPPSMARHGRLRIVRPGQSGPAQRGTFT